MSTSHQTSPPTLNIHFGDNLSLLPDFPDGSFELIYIDPPFNTGKKQARTQIRTVRDEDGDRVGFKGQRYRTVQVGLKAFADNFDDFLAFLEPRLEQAHRLLAPTGSFFLHLDYREIHYAKVLLDGIFRRDSFINEIIWAYDYGARSRKKWSAKHDNILWYAKDPKHYTYRYDDIDRIPYMAPGLVTPEKAARGKTPTDTWWHTIVSPSGKEKTGYPTQKPLGVMNRLIAVHSNPGDRVLDFFAGSGSTGEAAIRQGRRAVLIDNNEEAMRVMAKRLAFAQPCWLGWEPRNEDRPEPHTTRPCGRSGMKKIVDPEVQILAGIAGALEIDYTEDDVSWKGSPFAWIKTRPSRQVGAIGEKLVAGWLAARRFNVTRSGDSDADRVVEGRRVEIKFSTLWKNGSYKFQQLRDQRYDFVVCLGVSPFDAHCWVLPKSEILRQWRETGNLKSQHGGSTGSDTAWLHVDPDAVPQWLLGFGGSLRKGLEQISTLTGFNPD